MAGALLEELERLAADLGQTVERYDAVLKLLRQAVDKRLRWHEC